MVSFRRVSFRKGIKGKKFIAIYSLNFDCSSLRLSVACQIHLNTHTLLTTPLRSLGISKASQTQVGTKIVIKEDGRLSSRQESFNCSRVFCPLHSSQRKLGTTGTNGCLPFTWKTQKFQFKIKWYGASFHLEYF